MEDQRNARDEAHLGIDVGTFRAFAEFAAENPEAVIFRLEANGVAEGRALHTHASTGPFTLGGERIDRVARRYTYHFGAHREVEAALGFVDPTDREQETEVVLAALSGCINAVVTASAAVRGIDLAKLETNVSITWDPAVFLHLRDAEEDGVPVDQFGDLEIALAVAGDGLSESDISFICQTVRRSAVFNLIAQSHGSRIDVRKQEALEAAA